MIRRVATLAAAAVIGLTLVGWDRPAHADAKQLAESVPPQIPEIVSGGVWADGGKNGVYRAIVVIAEEGQALAAHVFLQWLAYPEGSGAAQIVATMPIKEVRERKLDNAYVFLEGEEQNEVQLSITSYDPKTEKESSFVIHATTPGKYSVGQAQ